jgi:hypothetical protein
MWRSARSERACSLRPSREGRDRLPERGRPRRRVGVLARPRGVGDVAFHSTCLPASVAYHGMLVPDVACYTCERQDFLLLVAKESQSALTENTRNKMLDFCYQGVPRLDSQVHTT